MRAYDFQTQLDFSRGVREVSDMDTLRAMIPGCVSVLKTHEEMDRQGVDYIARLRKGDELLIDAKTRIRECSKYWKSEPEVALEIWSVRPGGKYQTPQNRGKTGWTLSESKHVDLILYTFDPFDCDDVFLVSFPLLRMAFQRHYRQWTKPMNEGGFKRGIQDSFHWESECIFVPIGVVHQGISAASTAKRSEIGDEEAA